MGDHLVEELKAITWREVSLSECPIRKVVQVVFCKVAACKKILVNVYLRLVIYQLTIR